MARYVSKAGRFKKTVRKARLDLVNTIAGPEQKEVEPPLIAFFELGGATPREVSLALERFKFGGLSENENPARRLSIYDTDEQAKAHGWDAKFKAEVEAVLDAGQGEFYFKVESDKAPKPWPSYDEMSPKDIQKTLTLIGGDLDAVLAYERENENRSEVFDLLSPVEGHEVVVDA